MRFGKLAERQVLKAQAEGQLDGLKGAGKPLAASTGDTATEAGFRIMAEAGALPREITLRKEIEALRSQIAAMPVQDRRPLLLRLNDLELRLAIESESRRAYQRD